MDLTEYYEEFQSTYTLAVYDKAIFLINGEEVCLKYSDEEEYDFEQIKIGKYVGQIIYAKNLAQILELEIVEKLD